MTHMFRGEGRFHFPVTDKSPSKVSCFRCRRFVHALFSYGGTPGDRSYWGRRWHDSIIELVLPKSRSRYRAFWLVQWDVVDMWHVVQGDPDRGFCSNLASVERQDDLRKFHSFRSPWIAEVVTAGTSSRMSDGNGLSRYR